MMRLSFSDMPAFRGRTAGRKRRRKLRRLAVLQQLEPRQLLAADPNQAPAVTGGSVELQSAQLHTVSPTDLGYTDPDGDPMSHLTIESLPAIGSLELYDYPVYPGQWIDAYELSYGYLVYVPDSDASSSYSSSFSFTASDGSDNSSAALVTFNVTVAPNSPPAVTGSVHSLAAEQTHTLTLADLGYTDADGDPLQSLTILSLPSTGTLEYYGCPVYSGETFSFYEIAYGYLAYTPDLYAGSSHSDSFSFTASDGRNNSSPAQVVFNVTVIPNSPPTASGSAHALAADQTHTLTLANLGYSDADGDPLQSITIVSSPSTGTLQYDGYPIYGGETFDYYEIVAGYLTYHPDPYASSSHHDSFSFTTHDGRDNSSAATIHFHVTLGENTPPLTADTFISVPEDGYVMLGSAHFPFADADGDSFSHITILSLPSNSSLTYYGYPVAVGQTIDAYELDYGALELTFSSSASGNAVAAISFSVSDGIDSSAPATLTAILESSANQRPSTAPIQLDVISGKTLWFGPATFPYSDPDGDPLHHVTIHAVPSGAVLIDRDGNSLPVPTEITAQMLLDEEVGLYSAADPGTEFLLVFTVSDGSLDSGHSVSTVVMAEHETNPPEDDPPPRIDLSDWTGPIVTLADGFIPGTDAAPSAAVVAFWLDPTRDVGVVEIDEDDHWTYSETFDAGPSGDFDDSLVYVFVASGVGSTVLSYSVNVTGTATEPDDGSSPENQTPPDPPIPEAPLPSDQPDSLTYELTVTLDGDGNITDHMISGHYHSSYYFAFVDVPYGDEPAPEGGEGDERDHDPFGLTGTFTIILLSLTTLHFDSFGTDVNIGDQSYFSYSGGGSYQYDPLATAPISENTEEIDGDDGGDEASNAGEGEPAGDDSPAATGLVGGTFTESGLHTSTITATGRVRRDGTPDSLTLMDTWFDQLAFAYDGSGSYTAGETTGTIDENGSDTFIDDGSITLVLHPDRFELSGNNTLTAFGHSFYCDSWDTPINSDEDGATLLGNSWGSITLQDSYYDHFEFEIRPVQADDPDDPQQPAGDDPEAGGEEDETAPSHRWYFISGSFDDFVNVVNEGGYKASGLYSTTAGVGPDRGGETSSLDSPLSGTIEIGGTYKSSITYDASGIITPDEVSFVTGSLNLSEASASLSTISTSGPVNTGDLSGVIIFEDHHETDYLRDLTFDLTDPNVPAIGHGHDYVLTDTRFDQLASGTTGFDDMSGSQWANVKDHHFLEISVDYVWSNASAVDDSGGDGDGDAGDGDAGDGDAGDGDAGDGDGAIGGWGTKFTELTLIADADFDIGYNISGLVTRDGLSGQAGEHAFQKGFDFTQLMIVSKQDADPNFSFTTIHSSDDFFSAFHELSGDYTSEPIAPSGVIITGQAWETARSESQTTSFVSFSVELDQEPGRFGVFTFADEDFFAAGHSGAGDYTRAEGDTTFTGSALHEESFLSDNRLFVIYSLDDEGNWKLGPPINPLVSYRFSQASSRLKIKYDHSYQASGAIDGSRGSVDWNSDPSEASESGHAKYSMTLKTSGEPVQAPPTPGMQDGNETGEPGDGDGEPGDGDGEPGDGDGEPGDGDGEPGGDGSDPEDSDQEPASPLPALLWIYTGTLETDSSFLSQFERKAFGDYDSGTLSGSISEFFSFTSRTGHDDFFEIAADGHWLQSEGEIRASTQGKFLFDLDLSGAIGADNPHAGGMTGSITVRNHTGGDFDFEQTDTFSPASSGAAAGGSWSSEGKQGHSSRYHSMVSVDLAGTIHSAIGGASTPVELSFETHSYSAGYALDRFILNTTSTADQGPGENDEAWIQTIGASGSRNVSRSQNTKLATGETGFIDETMRSRNETTIWQRLLSPGGAWADGGRTIEDYNFSLSQGSGETKQLSMPMGQGGGTLTGESYQNSSQEMSVKTRSGTAFGDGPYPPLVAPGDFEGDLNPLISLPVMPEQAGTPADPDGDDPDGEADWHSGNYGRMIVSNSGGDSTGFSLQGSSSVDAGGAQPATAIQTISSNSSSGYEFELKSKLDAATGQWKNTSGSRSTSNASDDSHSFIVSGSWGSGSSGFALSGEFLDSTIHSNSNSSGSSGELDPATGQWTTSSSYGFSQFSKIDRTSDGTGSYSHDRYGFPVSGAVIANSAYHFTSDHSLLNIMVGGARSPESTGSRYSELSTRWMVDIMGDGEDRRNRRRRCARRRR